MRFMMLMIPKVYAQGEATAMPTPEQVEAMMRYNDALQQAGVLLDLSGLHPPAAARRVCFGSGAPRVIDGPFTEAREAVGGYWLLDVRSREEAVEWARRCPAGDGDVIEVRQVQAVDDFPPEVRKVIAAHPCSHSGRPA